MNDKNNLSVREEYADYLSWCNGMNQNVLPDNKQITPLSFDVWFSDIYIPNNE